MDREEFIKKMKRQLDELNYHYSLERDKFEAKAQHLSADAKKAFEKELEKLQELRKVAKEKIVDLDVASENAWHDVKQGAEEAWKALSKAFKNASSHFK
jgi:flagellar hook-basal body complex protein FliE